MAGRTSVQNSFTGTGDGTPMQVDKNERFTVSIVIGGANTCVLQRRMDGANWRTVQSFTADSEVDGIAAEATELRISVTVYAAGTLIARLGQ